ncbi:hypothetical protein L916_16041 [Phytophthora nicotianae]|uniref:Uncharacterized protein n=1 Tax=Phytophthora nicotianae TaxID=4792 RepID=W2I9Z3_PHYNI|nr:hypothetical protein L916_16041 [Phytophthora nicotianae]
MVFIWSITNNDMEAIDAQKALDSLPVSVGHKATARGYGLVRSAKASACAVVEHNQDDDELVASASGED